MLNIPPEQEVRFDRFSDSAGTYITLDSNNPAIYKQLYRAAKAKLKLRLRATVGRSTKEESTEKTAMEQNKPALKANPGFQGEPRNSFLETVLSQPVASGAAPSFRPFQKTCEYSPRCAIPGAFDLNNSGMEHLIRVPQAGPSDLYSLPTLPSLNDFPSTSYSIDCNDCGKSVLDEHYHCGICEEGDFDLCKPCFDSGVTCLNDEHWLLKRTIRNGVVIPSTTVTLPSKKMSKAATSSSEELTTPTRPEQDDGDLTCNSCICRKSLSPDFWTVANTFLELPAREFVTCVACPDFDLCLNCFQDGEHGHDPSHTFEPLDALDTLPTPVKALCAPGRGVRHDAICDGCEQVIFPHTSPGSIALSDIAIGYFWRPPQVLVLPRL